MNSVLLCEDEEAGFSFRNCRRNESLIKNGFKPSQTTKTGTTICGIVFKDGVVLGSDTRATSDNIVVDKGCEKIYYIQNNIYCCGAGTAADMQMTATYVSANMELIRMNSDRNYIPVKAAVTFAKRYLYRRNGRISCHLIFGGVDNEGPHIYSLHPHGSSDRVPYISMGSGCLAAMSVFETRWKPYMNEQEGVTLMRDGIAAGIFNDLGSGSNIDICVIRDNYHKLTRGYEIAVTKGERHNNYTPKRGTTGVLSSKKIDIEIVEEEAMIVE